MNTKIVKAIGLAICLSVSGFTQAEPAKAESIKRLMDVTGAGEMGVQVIDQLLPAMKQMVPDAPDQFWVDVRKEINADELENELIPLYQKHLTEEDVRALNAFYTSPVGRKMIRIQPVIMQESMMMGQRWGQDLARKIIAKYQAGG